MGGFFLLDKVVKLVCYQRGLPRLVSTDEQKQASGHGIMLNDSCLGCLGEGLSAWLAWDGIKGKTQVSNALAMLW